MSLINNSKIRDNSILEMSCELSKINFVKKNKNEKSCFYDKFNDKMFSGKFTLLSK